MKAGEESRSRAIAEDEPSSSYDTGESEEEGALEVGPEHTSDALIDTLEDIKSTIAALDATQKVFAQNLTALEKVVTNVQEDTTWVKGEVAVVHEILEKLADYVSMFTKTVAEVEGAPADGSPHVSAWGPWPHSTHPEERGRVDRTGIAEREGVRLSEEDRPHVHGGHDADSAIFETQLHEISAGTYTNITSLSEEGGEGGYQQNEEGGREMFSPKDRQQGGEDGDDGMEVLGTQVELTMAALLTGTQAPGRSMWSQFTHTVKDMPAPVFGGGDLNEGWVPSKRLRESWTESAGKESAEPMAHNTVGQETFNLNLSPEVLDTGHSRRGRGRNAGNPARGPGSRGGGRAGGRRAGRAKRLPVLQPRYTSTASLPAPATTEIPKCIPPIFVLLLIAPM